jgi:hypothetical protein
VAVQLIDNLRKHLFDFNAYFFLLNLNVLNAMPLLGNAYGIAI